MNIFLSSLLDYTIAANILLLIAVVASRKRVQWSLIEYPLIYLPWLCMYGLAVFTFDNAEAAIAANSTFVPLLSYIGGFFAAATTSLRMIWPKAEIGGFALSCASVTLMIMLYMKFLALFFLLFIGDV